MTSLPFAIAWDYNSWAWKRKQESMDSGFASKLIRDTIQRHGETRGIMTSAVDISELGDIPAEARLPTPHGDFRIRVFLRKAQVSTM